MEGLCRASSSLSITDSPPLFNEKWPKIEVFFEFRRRARTCTVRPKYLCPSGLGESMGQATPAVSLTPSSSWNA